MPDGHRARPPPRRRHRPSRRRPAGLGPVRPLPGARQPGARRPISPRPRPLPRAFAAAYAGKLAGLSGRGLAARDRRLRADRGDAGPADVLRPAAVQRRFHRPGDRPVLPVHQRAGDRDQQPPAVLHAGTEPARRRGAGAEARRPGAGALAARGCATCACSARTSSPTSWRSCCTRRRSPAAPPGAACSTRPSPACASRSAGEELTVSAALNKLSDRDRAVREAAGQAIGAAFGERHQAVLADHQHAGQGQGDHRHLAALSAPRQLPQPRQHGRGRGGGRAGHRRDAPISRGCRTAITR